jgi:hypothetical protein
MSASRVLLKSRRPNRFEMVQEEASASDPRRRASHISKMPLAKHDNVVKTFPPDRTRGASRRNT